MGPHAGKHFFSRTIDIRYRQLTTSLLGGIAFVIRRVEPDAAPSAEGE